MVGLTQFLDFPQLLLPRRWNGLCSLKAVFEAPV